MPDRLDRLSATRDALASAIESCESLRDLASLSREYRATLAEIEELTPKEAAGDAIDEIAARRSARRPRATKAAGRAKRSS